MKKLAVLAAVTAGSWLIVIAVAVGVVALWSAGIGAANAAWQEMTEAEEMWQIDTASDVPAVPACFEDQVVTFDGVCVTPGDPYVKFVAGTGWVLD